MKIKKAFSLIELSIVILIVGIIIAGVTQSSRLVAQFKTSSANSLTNSSPVNGISDLVLWLETTKKESFDANVDPASSTNNVAINWYDNNPQSTKVLVTRGGATNHAVLVENSPINSLPTLRFNGSSSFYTMLPIFSSSESNLTIYCVGMSVNTSTVRNTIFGQYNSANSDTNHFFSINNTSTIIYDEFMPSSGATISAASTVPSNVPFIVSVVRRNRVPTIYMNGAFIITGPAEIYSGSEPDSAEIGRRGGTINSHYFNGFIGEIIIFDRALTTEERTAIDRYLSKKWNIKLN